MQRGRSQHRDAPAGQCGQTPVHAAGSGRKAPPHLAAARLDREHRRLSRVVGAGEQVPAVERPLRLSGPAVPVGRARRARPARHIDQFQRRARRMLRRSNAAHHGQRAPVRRETRPLAIGERSGSHRAGGCAVGVDQPHVGVVAPVRAGAGARDRDQPAVRCDVEIRLDGELAPRLRRQVDPCADRRAGRSLIGDQVGRLAAFAVVEPLVPMACRLARQAPPARTVLALLGSGRSLLLERNARQHRREQHQPVRSPREAKGGHPERLVGQLLRLAALRRQQPHLHPLVGLLVGFDVYGLTVRQERERAVAPKTRRGVAAVAARELHGGRAVDRNLPQVRDVARLLAIEPLHGDGEPVAARGARDLDQPAQLDVLLDRIRHVTGPVPGSRAARCRCGIAAPRTAPWPRPRRRGGAPRSRFPPARSRTARARRP